MRNVIVFVNLTADGYLAGPNGELDWAHKDPDDAEWNAFVAENAKGGGALLFGRKTYEMMAGYWPTPMAAQQNPVVAERMNALPKFVVSRTLDQAAWSNTVVLKGDLVAATRKLKDTIGPDIAILGSGSIVTQLAQAKLIDGFQIVVCPLVLGPSKRLFDGVRHPLNLSLTGTREFKNGSVLLNYAPD